MISQFITLQLSQREFSGEPVTHPTRAYPARSITTPPWMQVHHKVTLQHFIRLT